MPRSITSFFGCFGARGSRLFWWLVGSVALGLFLIGHAVHTTDVSAGEVLFWAGLLMGNGGWFASMAWAWYRAHQRGGF